jgi:23S rRNA pseudouridine2605 synthase
MAPPPEAPPEKTGERIAKLLARAGIASRREVERMIADGRVRIGEEVITTPATILTNLSGVFVDGKPVAAPVAARMFRFHKPQGLLTAERDFTGRSTIYDALRNALPPGTSRMMPVGRLDLNTEGLLLLTNDGELKRALELPSTGIPRTYRARTFGEITQARLEDLMEGIEIEGVRYGPINANMERSAGHNKWIELTLTEGKNREVRRVLEHLGLQVSRLMRIAYGPFLLADLPRGAAEEVRPADVERFRAALKLAPEKFAPARVPLAARPKAPEKAAMKPAAKPGTRPVAKAPGRPVPPAPIDAAPQPEAAKPPRAAKKPVRRIHRDDGKLVDRPARAAPQRPGKGWAKAKPKLGTKPGRKPPTSPKGPRP